MTRVGRLLLVSFGAALAAVAAAAPATAAPPTTANDVRASVSDVTFQTNGPGTYQGTLGIAVRNEGTAEQDHLAISVRAPAQATIVDAFDAHGVYLCGPAANGEGAHLWNCFVSRLAAGQGATIELHLSATTPLPAGSATQYGAVYVTGYNKPDAYPDDLTITYATRVADSSVPQQAVSLKVTATAPVMKLGSDGRYHGTVSFTAANNNTAPVDQTLVEVAAPDYVTVDTPTGGGWQNSCVRIPGDALGPGANHNLHSGLRCVLPLTRPSDVQRGTFGLTAVSSDTAPAVGMIQLEPVSTAGTVYTYPWGSNWTTFAPVFTTASAAPAPSASGVGAGTTATLPVTGTPTGVVLGGGAAALALGFGLFAATRLRRTRHQH
jgi:hypothetical protein